MIFDAVVILSIVMSAAFTLAWLLRPDFRAWVEQPKHVFDAQLRQFDEERRPR